jgi:hypothetical protein
LNGKLVAATCATTACELSRDDGMQKYAGLDGAGTVRTIGSRSFKNFEINGFFDLCIGGADEMFLLREA